MIRFDYCISNPPYQLDASTEANNSAHNIFHYFYATGLRISEEITMIFPGGRWMQLSTRAGEAARIIYPTVRTIDWYYNGDENHTPRLFPNVAIPDGVVVVTADNKPQENIILNGEPFRRPAGNQILPLSPGMSLIAKKISENFENFIVDRKHPIMIFGVPTYYVEKNLDKVIPYGEDNSSMVEPVRAFLANEKKKTSKRVEQYWMPSTDISWNDITKKLYDRWKICITQAGASKPRWSTKSHVVPDETIICSSWIIIGDFETEEEAVNYKKYVDCDLTRKLIFESRGGKTKYWGYFVPDLGDYSNENPDIDWSKPLDPQLYELFGFTEEEIGIIEDN